MYIDNSQQLTVNVPTAGTFVVLSASTFQQNAGTDTSLSWNLGEGERLYAQWECVTPLVDAGGGATAVAQFILCQSDVATLISANLQVLAQGGGFVNVQTTAQIGWTAGELTTHQMNAAGYHFEQELPGYFVSRIYEHRALPYLGGLIVCPNYHIGGNTGFSAGSFKLRIVKDVVRNPLTRMIASRMPV